MGRGPGLLLYGSFNLQTKTKISEMTVMTTNELDSGIWFDDDTFNFLDVGCSITYPLSL